jgi:hypothetical protein
MSAASGMSYGSRVALGGVLQFFGESEGKQEEI